jgi:hypothetical protein
MPSSKHLFREVDTILEEMRLKHLSFDEWEQQKREKDRLAARYAGCVPFDDDYAAIGMIQPEFITYEVQDGFYTERLVLQDVPVEWASVEEYGTELPTAFLPVKTERLPQPMPRMKRVTELIWRPSS